MKFFWGLYLHSFPVFLALSNGLAGPPGSGKSTLAFEVTQRINKLWFHRACASDPQVKPPDVAIVIPMDGFHLYRSQLDAMENPKEAHARRGAPWTFDPMLLLNCLKNLRDQGSVYAPSFNHGVGDPVEDDIFVSLQHKVAIVEGNYLLSEEGVWKEISSIFDEKWFIDVDLGTAMQRVLERHISTGKPPDVAQWRVNYNDRPNAEFIMKSKKNADLKQIGEGDVNVITLILEMSTLVTLGENYRLYARSHFVKAIELGVILVLYASYSPLAKDSFVYIAMTISSWFLVVSWIMSPFVFNPSGFDWLKTVYDFDDFMNWIWCKGGALAEANKSWEIWWYEEQDHLRTTGLWGKLLEIILDLRFFFFQYGIVYQLGIANHSTNVGVYLLSWI
ncbi:phosphoribulokinase/uridine kinase family protein [Hibiscus syriacus]|uniref:Phosphoribulokinase/uridine kinase family protein n=1 Tax=Hibiscus syriacus TaxID=106335 RepID=A0A6A2YR60_HIBSY|nr:phosphoribulokinase/uridine kinase family protein [Hibiscus syriacus]